MYFNQYLHNCNSNKMFKGMNEESQMIYVCLDPIFIVTLSEISDNILFYANNQLGIKKYFSLCIIS